MVTLLMAAMLAAGPVAQKDVPANPQAAALADFTKRLEAYLHLREKMGDKLEPMKSTPSAYELHARQQALATALRAARTGAKPGDLVPPPVQEQLRQTVSADFKRRAPAAKKAALEEVPEGPLPAINTAYPEEALATVPPLLLASLPKLPDNLQYRFFGRHLVILDGDVEIVIDYVRDAVPR
jgi:hypothetical protein